MKDCVSLRVLVASDNAISALDRRMFLGLRSLEVCLSKSILTLSKSILFFHSQIIQDLLVC